MLLECPKVSIETEDRQGYTVAGYLFFAPNDNGWYYVLGYSLSRLIPFPSYMVENVNKGDWIHFSVNINCTFLFFYASHLLSYNLYIKFLSQQLKSVHCKTVYLFVLIHVSICLS